MGQALTDISARNFDLLRALRAIKACRTSLRICTRAENPSLYADAHECIARCNLRIALGSTDQAPLRDALSSIEQLLDIWNPDEHPKRWASAIGLCATIQHLLGQRVDPVNRDRYWADGVTLTEYGLAQPSTPLYPKQWAELKRCAGVLYGAQGEVDDHAMDKLELAISSFREACSVHDLESEPFHWHIHQLNIGSLQLMLGKRRKDLAIVNQSIVTLEHLRRMIHEREIQGAHTGPNDSKLAEAKAAAEQLGSST